MKLITGGRLIAHRDPVRELLGVERVWRSPLKSDMGRRRKTMRRHEFAAGSGRKRRYGRTDHDTRGYQTGGEGPH
jgi:hypothetical protein